MQTQTCTQELNQKLIGQCQIDTNCSITGRFKCSSQSGGNNWGK